MSYKPSKYWVWLNEQMMEMFQKNNGYENFKRTAGHIYNDDYNGILNDDQRKIHNLNINSLWQSICKIVPKNIIDKFEEPLEGNPVTATLEGRNVSIDLGCSILEYWNLSQHINFNEIDKISEIGGGYGRTAYVITKLHPHIEYTLYDIEPTLSIAKRYLSSVAKWGNFKFKTPNKIGGKCDLLIAIDCLAEMTRKQVSAYFDYANKNSSYFFFVSWFLANCAIDNIEWKMTDYPVRVDWKELFKRPHIRDGWFEALYKIGNYE